MNDRIQRIKDHVRENRMTYLVGGACFVIGASGTLAVTGLPGKVNASQRIISWKPENVTQNIIQTTVLARRGHPGYVVKCNETGELFASISRAAEMLGVDRSGIRRQLKGESPHVEGYTFTKLGEAQAA